MSEEASFGEIGKLSLEKFFEIQGNVESPILVFEKDGVITVQSIPIEEGDATELHVELLHTIVDLIRRCDLPELFVGYEGFYLMEEGAARVLVGNFYSNDEEQVWLAQIHGKTVGEWQDISSNPNRFGFEGLFKKAKAYCWN